MGLASLTIIIAPITVSATPNLSGSGGNRRPAPKPANAAPNTGTDCSKDNCDLIGKYVNPAIDLLSLVFGVIAAISLVVGGMQYSTSTGDPQKVSLAKRRIINTIIAVVAYLFLFTFLQFLIPGGIFH